MDWYRISLVLVTWSSATAAIRFLNTWRVKCTLDLAVKQDKEQSNRKRLKLQRHDCLAKGSILLWADPFLTKDHLTTDSTVIGSLSKPRRQQKRQRHQTKGSMSRTIAVYARCKSLHIALQSSAKQQREMAQF